MPDSMGAGVEVTNGTCFDSAWRSVRGTQELRRRSQVRVPNGGSSNDLKTQDSTQTTSIILTVTVMTSGFKRSEPLSAGQHQAICCLIVTWKKRRELTLTICQTRFVFDPPGKTRNNESGKALPPNAGGV